MTDKTSIRKEILKRRNSLDPSVMKEAGAAAAGKYSAIDELKNARELFVFLSAEKEISTENIISHSLKAGKGVSVPAYMAENDSYYPARYSVDAELAVGHMKIREPVNPIPVKLSDVDVVIVPGLAFDEKGGRLGYGKGYYDRMLAIIREAKKGKQLNIVGMALDFQVIEAVPMDNNDVRMDVIVTEKRVIKAR